MSFVTLLPCDSYHAAFITACKAAAVFIPKKPIRFFLMGVNVRFESDGIVVQSTDTHVLFSTKIPANFCGIEESALPRSFLLTLDAVKAFEADSSISFEEKNIAIQSVTSSASASFPYIEGKFPNAEHALTKAGVMTSGEKPAPVESAIEALPVSFEISELVTKLAKKARCHSFWSCYRAGVWVHTLKCSALKTRFATSPEWFATVLAMPLRV